MADRALIQRAHPEWGIISSVDAPGGGVWSTNAKGEVFATDQAGNPDSSVPYFGGYTTLPPAQRAGQRTITSIQRNQMGGYTLVSNFPGQDYAFGDPSYQGPAGAPGAAPVGATPAPAGAPAPTASDRATIDAFLASIGLGTLASRAFERYQALGATPSAIPAIMLELRSSDEYKARFPGMAHIRDLAARGAMPDWTESQYLAYEQAAFDVASRYNLPPGYITRASIGEMIDNDWSVDELTDTIAFAAEAAVSTPPEVLAQLNRLYGLDSSDLTVYYLDPDKGTGLLEEQSRLRAAGIAGAAGRVGFGDLSRAEAERLGQRGMSASQATEAFGQAAALRPLTQELVGEREDLGRDDLMSGIVEGNVDAQTKLQRRRAQRVAAFEGGGGAAGFGTRGSGLGSADQ